MIDGGSKKVSENLSPFMLFFEYEISNVEMQHLGVKSVYQKMTYLLNQKFLIYTINQEFYYRGLGGLSFCAWA